MKRALVDQLPRRNLTDLTEYPQGPTGFLKYLPLDIWLVICKDLDLGLWVLGHVSKCGLEIARKCVWMGPITDGPDFFNYVENHFGDYVGEHGSITLLEWFNPIEYLDLQPTYPGPNIYRSVREWLKITRPGILVMACKNNHLEFIVQSMPQSFDIGIYFLLVTLIAAEVGNLEIFEWGLDSFNSAMTNMLPVVIHNRRPKYGLYGIYSSCLFGGTISENSAPITDCNFKHGDKEYKCKTVEENHIFEPVFRSSTLKSPNYQIFTRLVASRSINQRFNSQDLPDAGAGGNSEIINHVCDNCHIASGTFPLHWKYYMITNTSIPPILMREILGKTMITGSIEGIEWIHNVTNCNARVPMLLKDLFKLYHDDQTIGGICRNGHVAMLELMYNNSYDNHSWMKPDLVSVAISARQRATWRWLLSKGLPWPKLILIFCLRLVRIALVKHLIEDGIPEVTEPSFKLALEMDERLSKWLSVRGVGTATADDACEYERKMDVAGYGINGPETKKIYGMFNTELVTTRIVAYETSLGTCTTLDN